MILDKELNSFVSEDEEEVISDDLEEDDFEDDDDEDDDDEDKDLGVDDEE